MTERRPVVLVLRPEGVSGSEAERFVARGWAVETVHPLALQPEADALFRLPEALRRADAVFWVSPGAVGVAASVLGASFSADIAAKPHIAVGKSTAQALRAHGCLNTLFPPDGHDSEAVLRLPLWHEISGSLLVVRGVGGRDTVVNGARAAGWTANVLEIYRRAARPVDWEAWQRLCDSGCLKAVYVTAWSVLEAWLAQMPPPLRDTGKSLLYFTHHARIAAVLRAHGLHAEVLAGQDADFVDKELHHE